MDAALERLVWQRSQARCEYCGLSQACDALPFHVDHVIALKHSGPTVEQNLALACFNCNMHKGPNIAGIDPDTGLITQLFHPRTDQWDEHFRWQGPRVVGRTAIGRTTVLVLAINLPPRVAHRAALIAEGRFPAG